MNTSENKNRRQFERLAIQDEVVIWTEDKSWKGQLVNQSLGGVGVSLAVDEEIQVGTEIRVRGECVEAIGFVRYRREENGQLFIGIAWDERDDFRKERKDDAIFFVAGPLEVVCLPNVEYTDDTATFELWDGTKFTESVDHLQRRTVDERLESLSQDAGAVADLLCVYRLGECVDERVAVDRIVDFEFSM